jgi:hypothetical protein
VQRGAVDTATGDAVVPVLGDGPASDDAGSEAERSVDGEVDDEGEEVTLGATFREDALALEEDGELDGEVGYRVSEDGGVEGLEEVGQDGIVDCVAEAVADLWSLLVVLMERESRVVLTFNGGDKEGDGTKLAIS